MGSGQMLLVTRRDVLVKALAWWWHTQAPCVGCKTQECLRLRFDFKGPLKVSFWWWPSRLRGVLQRRWYRGSGPVNLKRAMTRRCLNARVSFACPGRSAGRLSLRGSLIRNCGFGRRLQIDCRERNWVGVRAKCASCRAGCSFHLLFVWVMLRARLPGR